MPINPRRYVDITSGAAGAAVVPMREFIGLVITQNSLAPVGSRLRFISADAVADYFGSASDEHVFAQRYFAYVSPPPASKPEALAFTGWASTARAPVAIGDAEETATLEALKLITAGTLSVTLKGETQNLTAIDLSGAANLAAVATAVQTKLRAASVSPQFATATVAFTNGEFTITGAVAETANIAVNPTGGANDLAAALGFTGFNAVFLAGSDVQTALESLQKIVSVNDSFGSFQFLSSLGFNDAESVAVWNSAENVRFMNIQAVDAATRAAFAALNQYSGTALVYNVNASDYVGAVPAAILAAIDFDRRNSLPNFMFRDTGYSFGSVNTDPMANDLDSDRINYMGETATAGQTIRFFQRGYLGGNPSTAIVDMTPYTAEMWVKSRLAADFLNLLITQQIVPASAEGRAMGFSVIDAMAVQGLRNGAIMTGRELDNNERIAVRTITGSDLAYLKIQSDGYWADIQIVRETNPNSGLSEWVLKYTLVYAAAVGVRKVEGSHNVLS